MGTVAPLDAALRQRMATSWRPGCPVPLEDLRYLRVSHVDLAGRVRTGELVVSARVADQVVAVFRELYAQRFPIRSLRLVDDFGGSDDASMAADNSSAFNCRPVTGGTAFSAHSTGEAIDLNPRENPYLSTSGRVLPPEGRAFLDRRPGPGVIRAGGPVVAAFARIGWSWGGGWTGPRDYQHFSRSGR